MRVVIEVAHRRVEAVHVLACDRGVGGVIGVFKQNDRMTHVSARGVPDIVAQFIRNGLAFSRFCVKIIQCAVKYGTQSVGLYRLELK